MHAPAIAATTGLALASMPAMSSRRVGLAAASGVPNSRMSAPPENSAPTPMSTMAPAAGSDCAWATARASAARSAWPRPLTGGLSRMTRATSPSTS